MSIDSTDRGWFSYRYAVPGFVFVILFFLLDLKPILGRLNVLAVIYSDLSSNSGLGIAAIVAFLTFISSPALGFIISQGWYLLADYHRIRKTLE